MRLAEATTMMTNLQQIRLAGHDFRHTPRGKDQTRRDRREWIIWHIRDRRKQIGWDLDAIFEVLHNGAGLNSLPPRLAGCTKEQVEKIYDELRAEERAWCEQERLVTSA